MQSRRKSPNRSGAAGQKRTPHSPHSRSLRFESLEDRRLLAALDFLGVTDFRADARFADIDGDGLRVAVIGSGVDASHPELNGRVQAGFDFVQGGNGTTPVDAKGTHIAGLIAGETLGVAPGVEIIPLQVRDAGPVTGSTTSWEDLREALQWVIENAETSRIAAVQLPMGDGRLFFTDDGGIHPIQDLVDQLTALDVSVVSPAGDQYGLIGGAGAGADVMDAHGASDALASTFAVAATWPDDVGSEFSWQTNTVDVTTGEGRLTSFTQRPPGVTGNVFAAPGAMMTTTALGGGQTTAHGTDLAAATVTGLIALLQDTALTYAGRMLTVEEVQTYFLISGTTLSDADDEDAVTWVDANGDGIRTANETGTHTATDSDFVAPDLHEAALVTLEIIEQIAPTPSGAGEGDPNGVIAGALRGPVLGPAAPVFAVQGDIGQDGVAIGGDDVDLFQFEVASRGAVRFETSSVTPAADFDSLIRLFNDTGQLVAFNEDDLSVPGSEFSRLELTLDPGFYFVGVSNAENLNYDPNNNTNRTGAETGSYHLEIQHQSQDPNGLAATATPIQIPGGGNAALVDAVIGSDEGIATTLADVDFYRWTAPDDGLARIDIDTPGASGFADTHLRIYRLPGGTPAFAAENSDGLAESMFGAVEFANGSLVFDNAGFSGAHEGHDVDPFIAVPVSAGEQILIGVSDQSNPSYDPATLNGRIINANGGDYRLQLQFENADLNGMIEQVASTAAVSLPLSATFAIGTDDAGTQAVGGRDIDLFPVELATPGSLHAAARSFSSAGITEKVDTTLHLFDANGALIARSYYADGLDPQLSISLAAGRYYVGVSGDNNSRFDPMQLGLGVTGEQGDYELSISVNSADVDGNDQISEVSGNTPLSVGSTVQAELGTDPDGAALASGDVDLYPIQVATTQRLQVNTTDTLGDPVDAHLRIFSDAGNELVASGPAAVNNSVEFTAQAGVTYYVGVSGAATYDPIAGGGSGAANVGSYELSIAESTVPLTWQNPVNRFDVNDDGNVTISDLRLLFGDFITAGTRSLDEPPPIDEPFLYIDVSGDELASVSDVRQLFSVLIT